MQQHRSELFLNCSAASPGSSTRTAGLIQARSSETPHLFMHNGNTIFHRPSALRGTLGPDKKCGRSWQWLSASEQVSSLSGSVEQCAHQGQAGASGLVRMEKEVCQKGKLTFEILMLRLRKSARFVTADSSLVGPLQGMRVVPKHLDRAVEP